MEVLHLIPGHADRLYGAGHWKACQAIRLALRDLGVDSESRVFKANDGGDLPPELDGEIRDVIVEYSRTPEVVAEVRRRCPGARVHIRAHNAEAWHHMHRNGGLALVSPRNVYAVCRLLERDSRCRRMGESVLSISAWDGRHYWSRLPGRARILSVPYFSPWPVLRPDVVPRPWAERESVALCLPGARDPIGRTAADGFYDIWRRLSPLLPDWRFRISAGLIRSREDNIAPDGVETIDDLKEPWDLLCATKVVAVLTPLGYGAKTTVFDALAAGCHVLVHPKIADRLPSVARRACIVVDARRSLDAGRLADALRTAPAAHEVQSQLRAEALDNLAVALQRSNGAQADRGAA